MGLLLPLALARRTVGSLAAGMSGADSALRLFPAPVRTVWFFVDTYGATPRRIQLYILMQKASTPSPESVGKDRSARVVRFTAQNQ